MPIRQLPEDLINRIAGGLGMSMGELMSHADDVRADAKADGKSEGKTRHGNGK